METIHDRPEVFVPALWKLVHIQRMATINKDHVNIVTYILYSIDLKVLQAIHILTFIYIDFFILSVAFEIEGGKERR